MIRIGKVFYGWVIVATTSLVFAIVRGVNDSFGVFFVAIVEEFGWGRAAVAGVFSFGRLVEGAASMGVGLLSDRFGLRRIVPISACIAALGLLLTSYASSLAMLYVSYGLVFAIGYCGLGEISHVPVISRWFVRRRGMAIGLAMAGMGLGIVMIVPLAQTFILYAGWRWAYVLLAAVMLIGIIPPTLLFQRERPEDMGLLPDGETAGGTTTRHDRAGGPRRYTLRGSGDWTLRQALRTPTLWLLFAMRICTPLGMMMVVPHHVVYLVGQGFDKIIAALAFGILGIFSFSGRIMFGWLSDRFGPVPAMIFSYWISIAGTLLLLSLHDPSQTWLLWCHIVIYGIGFGARGPLTSSLVTELFHGKSWRAVLGFLEIGSGIGGTIGPWLSGFLFDQTGSYSVSFGCSMAVLALASVCAWLTGRQWRRDTVERRTVAER